MRAVTGSRAFFPVLRDESRSFVAEQGVAGGAAPCAGGYGGCPPISLTFLRAEQRASDAQPTEAS
jgi:hypothetical protein